MSYANEQKVVGQPCRFCQTPYTSGAKGAYCKPCYVKWKNGQSGGGQSYSPPQAPQAPARDFDKEARGKVRHGFAIEAFKGGMELNKTTADLVNKWTNFVVTGAIEPTPEELFAQSGGSVPLPSDPPIPNF